jgi:hypothetical protein
MSATSRSCARSAALAAAFAAALASGSVAAPPLPAAVVPLLPEARVQGSGELTWYGLPIYTGHLWSADGSFAFDEPFALDLHYKRDLAGRRIAERSVEEMAKLGADASDLARWGGAMARIFPDVRDGDRIVGVHVPGRGANFFHNGRPLGTIDDAGFARAFFGIWLDPRTSEPALRRRLLGRP